MQPPAQCEVLADRADPGIREGIAYRLGNRIEAALLCGLVGMIEIELVAEFVERHRKGERPTVADFVGCALILAAAACVLLAPSTPSSQTSSIEP